MSEQAGDETGKTDAEPETGEADAEPETGDTVPETELADRVAAHDEELAAAVDERIRELERRVETLESDLEEKDEEVDDLVSRLKRKQADFQNFKKRQKKKREQLQERATEELVERLLPVRDNLLRALQQDDDADIRPGVQSTLEQFDDVLEAENVDPIEPDPGEEVDPQRHEVMLTVDSDEPEDTIAELYQPGYEMGERVLRAAQVTVSNGSGSDAGDGGDGGDDGDDGDDTTADADDAEPDAEPEGGEADAEPDEPSD